MTPVACLKDLLFFCVTLQHLVTIFFHKKTSCLDLDMMENGLI